MITDRFKCGGALTDRDVGVYVERNSDYEILVSLGEMQYVLLIEPRQQGKTSLINHLMYQQQALDNAVWAYVDITALDNSTDGSWYQTICQRILRQLRHPLPNTSNLQLPHDRIGWREFLSELALLAVDSQRSIVIALDEIGAATFPGVTEFFSVLRDIYNSRQAEQEFKNLTFMLSGAFHPRDLIADDRVSPFNIAQRVRLADFTPEQVQELVRKGPWMPEQAIALAHRIYFWTDGQPYLAQLLCTYLQPNALPKDVDSTIERLRRDDENHLPPLLERYNADSKFCEYVAKIQAGERIKFYPRENRRQAQLELLGVIKADEEGNCRIRNRIYEVALGFTNSHTWTTPNIDQPTEERSKTEMRSEMGQVDFAIITALAIETKAVVRRLQNHQIQTFEDQDIRTYHYGTIPAKNKGKQYRVVVVTLPNMGNVSSANAVTDTIARWDPRFVLMVGIAGGIPQDDLDLGDIVIAEQVVGYEYGKMTDTGIKPRDHVYPASALLLDRVRNFWDETWIQHIDVPRPSNAKRDVSKSFVGPIASGNKIIASTDFRNQLLTHWPKLMAVEMESEGVFAAVFDRPQIRGTLVVRGICDMADERKSDEWQEYAANAAASFAIGFLESRPIEPSNSV